MRIYEVVDAEGQLGLLRTIIDNTWSAIAQQAEQQRKAAAQQKAVAKAKPSSKKGRKGAKASAAPQPSPAQLSKPSQPTPSKLSTAQQQPAATTQFRQQPQSKATAANQAQSFSPKPASALSVKSPYTTTKTNIYKDIDSVENEGNETDRHSRNGLRIAKK